MRKLLASLLLFACHPRNRVDTSKGELVPEPLPLPEGASLVTVRSIRGTGPDDIWVLGRASREGASTRERFSVCFHFDGTSWSTVDMPPRVTVLAPVAKGDVWGAGVYGTVAHWDGHRWDAQKLAVDFDLLDVAAVRDQVWVVASGPEIHHFDGSTWSVVKPAEVGENRLQEIFAVGGQVYVPASRKGQGAIAQFDGTTWRREVVGDTGVIRIAGTAPDDLWAFTATNSAYHFDGKGWRATQRATQGYLIDAWAASPNEVWLTGKDGTLERWDGQAWHRVATGTRATLWSVWAAPGGPVLVGGDAGLLRKR